MATLRRAYAGLSLRVCALLFALVAMYIISLGINYLLAWIRDGKLGEWLLLMAQGIGNISIIAAIIAAILVPAMNLAPPAGWRRIAVLALALVFASCVGGLVRVTAMTLLDTDVDSVEAAFRFAVRYGTLAGLLLVVVEIARRKAKSTEAMHQARLDRVALDQEMAEARLRVLQAQVEPHFLFNTLANVLRLYDTDSEGGNAMLDNLMRYLEVALPRMREERSTLEREVDLIDAYLNVHRVRMGPRLRFTFEIPEALRLREVPPLMLLSLAENAVKHGLNPLPEGGSIVISAHERDGVLTLEVADSGVGFGTAISGRGTGLANIRARLTAMFGEHATLDLAANLPRGLRAIVVLPQT